MTAGIFGLPRTLHAEMQMDMPFNASFTCVCDAVRKAGGQIELVDPVCGRVKAIKERPLMGGVDILDIQVRVKQFSETNIVFNATHAGTITQFLNGKGPHKLAREVWNTLDSMRLSVTNGA
ncbi:MAG: hypothetical protein MI864_28845 [Pseudomonadales bacterium]|nr:hypothetical protein [Pseudomonadales bacterium]